MKLKHSLKSRHGVFGELMLCLIMNELKGSFVVMRQCNNM